MRHPPTLFRYPFARVVAALLLPLTGACASTDASESDAADAWQGTIDTLASGQIVVHNTGHGAWRDGEGWRVIEELRIGSLESNGPDMFGAVASVELDPGERLWVVEWQAQEIRVFDTAGVHVRTIGRQGGGPGEFEGALRIDLAPYGNMWVMDARNARLSMFDTAGNYIEGHTMGGGFTMLPWPGGFDEQGRYYVPTPDFDEGFAIDFARFTVALVPIDTLSPPDSPLEPEQFKIVRDGRTRVSASVPFAPGFDTELSPAGTFWGMLTGEYRLFEIDADGDTLRTIVKAFEPVPVTDEARARAVEQLDWFTDQGGRVDASRIPDTKPPAARFFVDDEHYVWVATTGVDDSIRRWDIFDPVGRYLGVVELPFEMPQPRVRGDVMYGLVRDELDIPYVVRARIVRGE